jgi:hypothetical protein
LFKPPEGKADSIAKQKQNNQDEDNPPEVKSKRFIIHHANPTLSCLKNCPFKPHPIQISAPSVQVVLPLSAAERGNISFQFLEEFGWGEAKNPSKHV